MSFLKKLVSNISNVNSFENVAKNAPNKIGVYLFSYKGKVKYVGRAIENRPGQSTLGLRKRLKEHWRGASAGKKELFELRDDLTVKIRVCNSVEEARLLEAQLIRKYDTVNNGWNLRYED